MFTNLLFNPSDAGAFGRKFQVPLSKNVTLTIEIPNAEHAGMIARMEAWSHEDSIPQIMHDTGVLIQFPDLVPEGKYANDYVNRVSCVVIHVVNKMSLPSWIYLKFLIFIP